MKNKNLLIILIISLIMLLPIKALGKTYYDGYQTKNLKDTLAAEDLVLENKDYKENDKQAIIYLFRGQGCGYCKRFLTFLNSISKDYGKYFKLVSFEVWNDAKNAELMQKVAVVTNEAAGGVPYIIIGEKVFPGYIAEWDNDIKAAIKKQYDNNSYDIFKELEKAEKDPSFTEKLNAQSQAADDDTTGDVEEYSNTSKSSSDISNTSAVIWNLIFITIAAVSIIITIIVQNNKILLAIENQEANKVKKGMKK